MLAIRKSDLHAEAGQVAVVAARRGVHRSGDAASRQTIQHPRHLLGRLLRGIGAGGNGQTVISSGLIAQGRPGAIFGGRGHHALDDENETEIENTPEQQKKEHQHKGEVDDGGTFFPLVFFVLPAGPGRPCLPFQTPGGNTGGGQ